MLKCLKYPIFELLQLLKSLPFPLLMVCMFPPLILLIPEPPIVTPPSVSCHHASLKSTSPSTLALSQPSLWAPTWCRDGLGSSGSAGHTNCLYQSLESMRRASFILLRVQKAIRGSTRRSEDFIRIAWHTEDTQQEGKNIVKTF